MRRFPRGWDRADPREMPRSLTAMIEEFMNQLPPRRRAFCATELLGVPDRSKAHEYSPAAHQKMSQRTRASLHRFAESNW
jgi:hypothetical protein